MEDITVKDIVKACGGKLLCGNPETALTHISIDSRVMKGDDLFVPLIGEKNDAHDYIQKAFEKGAKAVLTARHSHMESEKTWIQVADTRTALQSIGAWYRDRLSLPLIGVTGSVGKTTTREMIAAALQANYQVYKTPGNSNSQVGVPITISEISKEDEIGVIELGISEPGEMGRIATVAKVNQAVVTNIGISHIEQLGSQETICREKLHIQDGMAEGGILYLNGDDPILRKQKAKTGCKTIYYGFGENCDYRATDIRMEAGKPVFTAVCKKRGESAKVALQVFGRHMIENAMAALAVAREHGILLADAACALKAYTGYEGRQQIHSVNGITIIDDSYNASPVSMKAAIQVLCDISVPGRKFAILADMKELGPDSPAYHREIGTFLANKKIDLIALFGELAAQIGEALKEEKELANGREDEERIEFPQKICLFQEKESLKKWLEDQVKSGDCVLFKGSNSMGLKTLVSAFLNP